MGMMIYVDGNLSFDLDRLVLLNLYCFKMLPIQVMVLAMNVDTLRYDF